MKHNPTLPKTSSSAPRTNVVQQNATAQPSGPGVSEQPQAPAAQAPSYDDVSARAYQLWEKNGARESSDLEHWYEAERQLTRGE